MVSAVEIRGQMEVVAADGVHIGKVDCMDGNLIRLARHHHDHGISDPCQRYVRLDDVASLASGKVWLVGRGSAVRILAREVAPQPVKAG